MKKVLSIILVAMLCGIAYNASAQYFGVTGVVTDESGEPLIGVTVMVKQTSTGTVTDMNGRYAIIVPAPDSSILVFSYIGFKTQEIRVNRNHVINVVMVEDTTALVEKNISDIERNNPISNFLNPIRTIMEEKRWI
jgi:translation initiation factor 6 (eIF-6)